MMASWDPGIRACMSARWPGVHSSCRPPTSRVGTPISPSRSVTSQVLSVPVTVNSLGPFIALYTS